MGDERVVAVRSFLEMLAATLLRTRERLNEGLAGHPLAGTLKPCPELSVALVQDAVRAACAKRPGFTIGWGYKTLAKAIGASTILAFAARLDAQVFVGIGVGTSDKASPGTTWVALSPWREGLSETVLERKLRAWVAANERLALPLAHAQLWLEARDAFSAPDESKRDAASTPRRAARRSDQVTEKQVAFIEVLQKRKGLGGGELDAILEEHGASSIDGLSKEAASRVIDFLLALP